MFFFTKKKSQPRCFKCFFIVLFIIIVIDDVVILNVVNVLPRSIDVHLTHLDVTTELSFVVVVVVMRCGQYFFHLTLMQS